MSLFNKSSRRSVFRRFLSENRGVAAVEFALIAPVFILLLAAVFELGTYIILNLKTQHAAISVADLVTRDKTISDAVITDLFNVVDQVMSPYATGGNESLVVVTAIGKIGSADPVVFWKRTGVGTMTATSMLGNAGSLVATPPAGLTMYNDESIVVVEVFYQYSPVIFNFLNTQTIKKVSYYRPRLGSLQTVL